MPPDARDVTAYLVDREKDMLVQLDRLLRCASVSADPAYEPGMKAARDFLLGYLGELGFADVRLLDGGGHPAVFASWNGAPGRPTLLIYGHYDVQPPDPLEAWRTPPFEPTVAEGRIAARGASDVKTSTMIALETVAAFLALGGCPVNIKVFLEGEEETGSATLGTIIDRYGALLQADAVLSADGGRASEQVPTINVGTRGMISFEVTLRSAATQVHSGRYGGMIRNAVHELARLVASLHDRDGRIAVPEFLDSVVALPLATREALAASPVDEADAIARLQATPFGDPAYSLRERATQRPAIDVNGIWGGYTQPGSKTIIPELATAKLSLRLAPGQDAEACRKLVEQHLTRHAAPGVTLAFTEIGGGSPAYTLPGDHALVVAARDVLREMYGCEPYLVRLGASVPITAIFKERLGIETLMFGLNLPDENVHAPNEFFRLASIRVGFKSWPALLSRLGKFNPSEVRSSGHV